MQLSAPKRCLHVHANRTCRCCQMLTTDSKESRAPPIKAICTRIPCCTSLPTKMIPSLLLYSSQVPRPVRPIPASCTAADRPSALRASHALRMDSFSDTTFTKRTHMAPGTHTSGSHRSKCLHQRTITLDARSWLTKNPARLQKLYSYGRLGASRSRLQEL